MFNINRNRDGHYLTVDGEALRKILSMARAHMDQLKKEEGTLPPTEKAAYVEIERLQVRFPELI